MLCGLKNTKNTSKVLYRLNSRLKKFVLERRSIEFDCPIIFMWVRFRSIAELNRTHSMRSIEIKFE